MSEVQTNKEQEAPEIEVRTDIEAGWQLKQRKEIIADRDELIAFYKERIKAVEEDAEFKIANIDRALLFFFQTVPHKKTATQEYYKHPLGKLMLKKQNPEYKRDDKATIDWLKNTPDGGRFIKVKEELDWSSLKAESTVVGNTIVNADGEVIPGIEVVEREAKFCVE